MRYFVVLVVGCVLCIGCRKPEPPMMRIYCCEVYQDVLREEAAVFASVYNMHVRLLPIFVPEPEEPSPTESTTELKRRSPAPWRTRPSDRRTLTSGRSVVDPRIKELIRAISDRTVYGDLYLTDSPQQAELLYEETAVSREYPFCVLTLTLLVAKDNPLRIESIQSLLDAERRLGIIEPSLDGMGETAFRLISKYRRVTAEGKPDERITLFDRQAKLLKALENGEVDAVLVWEPLTLITTEFAEVVELPEEERQAVRQPLLALSTADQPGYGKRFADFLISPRGRAILKKYGFTASD